MNSIKIIVLNNQDCKIKSKIKFYKKLNFKIHYSYQSKYSSIDINKLKNIEIDNLKFNYLDLISMICSTRPLQIEIIKTDIEYKLNKFDYLD